MLDLTNDVFYCGVPVERRVRDGRSLRFHGGSSLLERFVGKYAIDPVTHCFEWVGALKAGYGIFNSGPRGSGDSAHRWALENIAGVVIPEGFQADHLCNNPRCVNVIIPHAVFLVSNPDAVVHGHFRIVTPRENVLAAHSECFVKAQLLRTHCTKGHPLSGDNLRMEGGSHRRCRRCTNEKRPSYPAYSERFLLKHGLR